MRIGIDASPILRRVGGVGWHTYYLLRALLDLKEDLQFIGYVQPGSLRRHGGELTEEWINHQRLKYVEAGGLSRRWRGRLDGLDLYHGTNFKMRTVGKYGGIVTIHDLWLNRNPQYSTKLFGQRRAADRTKRTIARARKIITVSEHSAREITELYGVSRQNLAVIYNGVSEDFRPITERESFQDLRERLALPTERFILFAGGADPRKNHQTLLRAYARHAASLKDYSVVMVGEATHRFGDIRQTARTFDLEERVFCPGLLRMEELRLLYSHAASSCFLLSMRDSACPFWRPWRAARR
jgi:glycosyltransferase involved in cell wall biosynthesis